MRICGSDLNILAGTHPRAREMTSLVRPRGKIVNLSVFKKPVEIDMQAVNFKEVDIVGSRVYSRADVEAAIALAMELPLEPVITHQFALRGVSDAFRLFRTGDVCKGLILPMLDAA